MDLNINIFDSSTITENVARDQATIYYVDYLNGNSGNSGLTWALAKQRITDVASPGDNDEIRCAKSPDPVSTGVNFTFTDASETITLASALTTTIDTCDAAWSVVTNVTQASDTTNVKEGSSSRAITVAGTFTTGKAAYKALAGSTDYSARTKVTFWIKASVAVTASYLKLCLCSDATGDTIVDNFTIPYKLEAARWYPITLARDGGGAMGSAIQSVALYVITDLGASSVVLTIDNIEACDGFSLQSVIGKSNTETDLAYEAWWAIKSINGTTIKLGHGQQYGVIASTCTKYFGTSETVTGYYRNGIIMASHLATAATTVIQTINGSGGAYRGSYLKVTGGWDPATGLQDGMTFYEHLNGWGRSIESPSRNYVQLERFGSIRAAWGLNMSGAPLIVDRVHAVAPAESGGISAPGDNTKFIDDFATAEGYRRRLKVTQNAGGSGTVFALSGAYVILEDIVGYQSATASFINAMGVNSILRKFKFRGQVGGGYALNGSSAGFYRTRFEDFVISDGLTPLVYFGPMALVDTVFKNGVIKNSSGWGVLAAASAAVIASFIDVDFSGNTSGDIDARGYTEITLQDCSVASATTINMAASFGFDGQSRVVSYNHNNVAGDVRTWYQNGQILKNTTEYRTASPCVEMYKNTTKNDALEAKFSAPMESGVERTLKIWLKRTSAWGAQSIRIGARVGQKWVVEPTTIYPNTTYGEFQVTVPAESCTEDGVVDLVVQLYGSYESVTTSRLYIDDFTWA